MEGSGTGALPVAQKSTVERSATMPTKRFTRSSANPAKMMPWKVKDGFSGRRNSNMKDNAQQAKKNDKLISEIQDLVKKM